jgi:hypothetical protein
VLRSLAVAAQRISHGGEVIDGRAIVSVRRFGADDLEDEIRPALFERGSQRRRYHVLDLLLFAQLRLERANAQPACRSKIAEVAEEGIEVQSLREA